MAEDATEKKPQEQPEEKASETSAPNAVVLTNEQFQTLLGKIVPAKPVEPEKPKLSPEQERLANLKQLAAKATGNIGHANDDDLTEDDIGDNFLLNWCLNNGVDPKEKGFTDEQIRAQKLGKVIKARNV